MTPEESRRLLKVETTLKDQERRLHEVEKALKDWHLEVERARAQQAQEHHDMVEGAKRTVARAIEEKLAPLDKVAAEISATLVLQKDQTALLMDGRDAMQEMKDERIRRRTLEEVKAKTDADEAKRAQDAKDAFERKLKVWGVVLGILTILAGLAASAITSHH